MRPPSPQTMKAAQVKGYGKVNEMISVEDNVPVPSLSDELESDEYINPIIRMAIREDRKNHMIIKTLAVSLAPGDCRVLSGRTREFQGPPSFPYIPGGDCCGIVVEPCPKDDYFRKGDVVAARFTVAPRDAMGEYARVSTAVCEKVDLKLVSPQAAAALASASPAVILADYIQPQERVLILGAGGGVGSHLCQLARKRGASYVCGVSQTPPRLLEEPLNCDDAIDYTHQNVYELKKYQEEPFDLVIDLACGGWLELNDASQRNLPAIVRPASLGGRYVTPTTDQPSFDGRSLGQLLSAFVLLPLGRSLWSRIVTRNRLPTFTNANCLPDTREVLTRTLQLAQEGSLQAVIDGPYDMTTEGVRQAFIKQESRHGHGKVVVKVADLPNDE